MKDCENDAKSKVSNKLPRWVWIGALFVLALGVLSATERLLGRPALLVVKALTLTIALFLLVRGHLSGREKIPPVFVLLAAELACAFMLLQTLRELFHIR